MVASDNQADGAQVASPPAQPGPPQPRSADDPPQRGHDLVSAAVQEVLRTQLGERLARIEAAVAGGARRVALEGEEHVPAWLRPTAGEARWPVAAIVLAAIGLQLALPPHLALHPTWLLPGSELVLLVLLIAANPRRITRDHPLVRMASLTLVAVASLANMWSAALLVWGLIHGTVAEDAGPLLAVGASIWATNVIVFALWYWEFDRGGPVARAKASRRHPDFLFAQMQTPDLADDEWEPTFVDYLYLSFTNATAFSPTDTLPLSRWAKMAMLTQSCVSLATVALVVARAVNVLK